MIDIGIGLVIAVVTCAINYFILRRSKVFGFIIPTALALMEVYIKYANETYGDSLGLGAFLFNIILTAFIINIIFVLFALARQVEKAMDKSKKESQPF